jgi:hypothetical protein
MRTSSILAFLRKELEEMIPPTIFFAVGFNLILLTTNLILGQYNVHFSSVLLATTGALIIGKAVLVANALPYFRRFDNAPLIQPILFKSAIYFVVVCAVRFLEKLIEFLSHGGTPQDIPQYTATNFTWDRFFAIQLWILVLFLLYTFIVELNALFGDGELVHLLFTRRSTELKQTRRKRMRALARLSRLADAHTTVELADSSTAAHKQMIDLIHGLANDRTPPASRLTGSDTGQRIKFG